VGEVSKINIELDRHRTEFSMPVEIRLYPERLRVHYRKASKVEKPASSRETMNALVGNGFRAQLRSGNLLTGQLYVALGIFPKAPAAKIDWSRNPPEFPTLKNNMEQLQDSLMQIVQKFEKLPLEELAGDARKTIQGLETTLKSADRLINDLDTAIVPEARLMIEDVRTSLDSVRKTLTGAKQLLSADAPLQQDMRETLRELNRAARSLRTLSDYLEQHPESLLRGKTEDAR
jgi:paraquat-inducible protein B